MGYVPKCVVTYLKMVGYEVRDIKLIIRAMQMKSISGSVKICKMILNLEIMITLLTRNVLQQHLLEAGVISCFSNSYYEKFCKVLGECV